ncbi:MAG: cysteine hydrolase family protein, partial [Phycisphaerae bacterium]
MRRAIKSQQSEGSIMVRRGRRKAPLRIVLDLNTQCDLLLPRGAMPVVNRLDVIKNIRAMMDWARVKRIPVISSIDAHRPSESGNGVPRYCVDNTPGQRKLPFTLLPRRMMLPCDNTLALPCDVFNKYSQVILTRRTRDFLSNPKADRLVTEFSVEHFIVFGVVTAVGVKSVVLGLIARQRAVVVVSDAIGHWSSAEAELAVLQMAAKGA